MINSNTDGLKTNFGKSFTLLVVTTQKPSLSKDSANTSKKESQAKN